MLKVLQGQKSSSRVLAKRTFVSLMHSRAIPHGSEFIEKEGTENVNTAQQDHCTHQLTAHDLNKIKPINL